MSLVQSKQVVARVPGPTFMHASGIVAVMAEYLVPSGGRAVNDVVEFGNLPAGAVVVDATVNNTAAGASATGDLGLLSGAYGDASAATGQARTCGNEFMAAVDMNATTVKRLTKSVTAASTADDTTGWGMKVTGATWAAGTVVRAILYVAPAPVAMA
jgi:hypothetical protein